MSNISITDFIDFNPKRVIKRGNIAPFVDMAAIPVDSRDITTIEEREFKGGGSRFMNGDTLFARITPCLENGKTAKVTGLPDNVVANGSTEFIVMAAKKPEYDEDYVYYLARLPEFRAYAQSRMEGTSGRQRVSWQSLTEFKFDFPEKIVRKKIGLLLKTFDDKIQLNRQTNQTLEKIAQAIFKSWFVDFEPTRAKVIAQDMGADTATQELAAQAIICSALTLEQLSDIKQNLAITLQEAINTKLSHNSPTPINAEQLATTAALFPNALVESELGEIPEGWVVCQIEEVLERLKPSKRYTKKQVSLTGQVPVYEQGADILLGFHNDEPSFIATPDNPAFIFGDHTCVTHLSCQNFDISQNVIPLRGKSRPTMWVYYAVQGQQLFQEYRRHWSELIVKPIIYPAADICEKYSAVITKLVCKKESLEREGQSLAELRDTLLPKLLSGELDVSALADDSAPAIKTKEAFDV